MLGYDGLVKFKFIEVTDNAVLSAALSGRKSLYVDRAYSVGIKGLADEVAAHLLAFLRAHATREIYMRRLRWGNGTFVIWDNRSVIHYAFNDYDGYRREMYRIIVDG